MDPLTFSPDAATWAYAHESPTRLGRNAALVDLDGTLSDPCARVHLLGGDTPNWLLFSEAACDDKPIAATVDIVRQLSKELSIIVSSGRPYYTMALTIEWLQNHGVPWDLVALRPKGDIVSGARHKLRVLTAVRDAGLSPVVALDDSAQAGRVYKKEGIDFYQVQHP